MREPEPETIARARDGDLRAFEALVRDYQADAWRFAFHLIHDRAIADDVTQEAFLRAFRALRSYRGEAKFTSWLLRIVRNCAIDAYRRGAREEALRARTAAAQAATQRERGSESGPRVEERLRIQESLRLLPDELREPFVVIEVLGFNYGEASAILGVKLGTIKSRMHRARLALIRALAEEAAGEV